MHDHLLVKASVQVKAHQIVLEVSHSASLSTLSLLLTSKDVDRLIVLGPDRHVAEPAQLDLQVALPRLLDDDCTHAELALVRLLVGARHQVELWHDVLVVDAEATNVDRPLLVKLNHLCRTGKIDHKLCVADHVCIREDSAIVLLLRVLQYVELLPCLFVNLQVKLLLAADLLKLLNLPLMHGKF